MKVYKYNNITDRDNWEVVYRCLSEGPSYAVWLKKGLQLGFLNAFGEASRESEKYGEIFNYRDIYPHDHLIHWIEDDPMDILYSLVERECDPKALDEYEVALREVLEGVVVNPIPDEIITSEGGTSVCKEPEKYRGYSRLKTQKPNYVHKMEGRRTVINVGPANQRDAFVLTRDSSNTVSLISHLARQIVGQTKYSAMKRTEVEFETKQRKENEYLRKVKSSYLRDFKKAGLTMPHAVLKRTKEVLESLFPGLGFEYMDCLYNLDIIADKDIGITRKGESLPILSGHGLGMANEITTLAQEALVNMSLKRIHIDNEIKISLWNDDFKAVGYRRDLEVFKLSDKQTLSSLGYVVNETKTKVLRGARVFMEIYCTGDEYDYSKEVRDYLSMIDAYFAVNIVHAKELLRSRVAGWVNGDNEDLIKEVVRIKKFWGYEFYREEAFVSDVFGGWKIIDAFGMDETFDLSIFEKNIPFGRLLGAVHAETATVRVERDKRFRPTKFLDAKYLNDVKCKPEIRILSKHFDQITNNTMRMANQVWDGLSMRKNLSVYYGKLQAERIRIYNAQKKEFCTIVDLFNAAVKCFPQRSFYIPSYLIEEYQDTRITIEPLRSYCPYESLNRFDYVSQILLENKYIYNKDNLTRIEWLELIHKSGLVPVYGYTSGYDTVKEVIIPDNYYKYVRNHLTVQALYLLNEGRVPCKIHKDIVLPDRFEESGVPPSVVKELIELQTLYPVKLPQGCSQELEKVLSMHPDLDRQQLYDMMGDLLKEIPDDMEIEIAPEWDLEDCFKLIRKPEPPQSGLVYDLIQYFESLQKTKDAEEIIMELPSIEDLFQDIEFNGEEQELEYVEEYNYDDVEDVMEFSDTDTEGNF
jgi:hypothetical protein